MCLIIFARCPICILKLSKEESVREIGDCGHVFHSECLEAWLKVKPQCPVCKMELKPGQRREPQLVVVEEGKPLFPNLLEADEREEEPAVAMSDREEEEIMIDCYYSHCDKIAVYASNYY